MSFERAHAYAARGAKADDELDELAPGRLTRSQQLAPGRHSVWGLIQRKAAGAGGELTAEAERAIGRASTSAGLPLPEALRRKFEAALGADLSGVRIHTGGASSAAADAIAARAYTIGQDIHFAGGYDPTSAAAELLLAHEVAHTVQQRGSSPAPQLEVSSPGDRSEHEADRAAEAMVAGAAFALGTAPVVAARKADEQSGPGAITQENSTGFLYAPTQVHSAPDPKSTLLVLLPAGGWIHIIGSDGSFCIVSYDGTKKGYIDRNDLDIDGRGPPAGSAAGWQRGSIDGPSTAFDHDPPPAPGETAGQRYRSAIQKAIDFWKDAKEGDAKFSQFRSDKTLEKARKAAGTQHRTYTTCVDFLSQVQSDAAHDAHVKPVVQLDLHQADATDRKKLPAGAWHAASPNMTERPKAGDVYYLAFAKEVKDAQGNHKFGKGDFSHVGYFNGLEPAPATGAGEPTELWHTVDGGQGTSTQYDADGKLTKKGAEELKGVDRYYLPAKNLIAGEKIQGDTDARSLMGWVDVEKLVAADEAPESH